MDWLVSFWKSPTKPKESKQEEDLELQIIQFKGTVNLESYIGIHGFSSVKTTPTVKRE